MAFWKKWWGKEKVQKSLLIADLMEWLEQTQFANIGYFNGKIVKVGYEEPQVKYPSEVKKILKKHDLQLLFEKAKQDSTELQTKAEKSMKEFHDMIDGKLKTVQLTKSIDVSKSLAKNAYSFPPSVSSHFRGNQWRKTWIQYPTRLFVAWRHENCKKWRLPKWPRNHSRGCSQRQRTN